MPQRSVMMKEKVQAALDQIRPNLQRDGGDVELVEVTVRNRDAIRDVLLADLARMHGEYHGPG